METLMTSSLLFNKQDREVLWITASLLLSFFFHLLLAFWFWSTSFQQMAIPSKKIPIELKRIELPSTLMQQMVTAPTLSSKAPQTLEPPPQLPLLNQTLERTIETHAPAIPLPSAPQVELAQSIQFAPSASALSTPYKSAEQASIKVEIEKFQVGPPSLGAPVISSQNLTSAAQGIGNTPALGGIPGNASTANPPLPIDLPPTKAPSFEALSSKFQDPNASARLKLPQPVLLRFQSDILFDFDSSVLKLNASKLLEQVLPMIRNFPIAQITVEGHTDTFGTEDYNQKLSESRAHSVQEWFKQKLEPQYQVQSQGYGKKRPIVNPRGTIAEQAKNRRVEIVIQGLNP